MSLRSYSGTFEPADLALLERVFDRISKQRGILPRDSQKSDKLAAEIVLLFSQGARTEEALLHAIAQCGSPPSMLVTIRRISHDLYSVDWTTEKDAITVRVAVPRSKGTHIYTEAEREVSPAKRPKPWPWISPNPLSAKNAYLSRRRVSIDRCRNLRIQLQGG